MKLTRKFQKESCTIKAVRKMSVESGREGREAIKVGPAPLVEDTCEEWDYTSSKILPGGKQVEPHSRQPKPRL